MDAEDEIATLREQIRQLQQQQQQQANQQTTTQQQQQSVPASTVDSITAQAIAQMAEFLKQSQALNQQLISQISSKTTEPVKEPPMPKWDGNITTKDLYLEQMEVYKSHKYFSSVIDWSRSTPATEDIATFLRSELLKTIPASRRPAYLHQDKCKDGFAFLKLWMSNISPSNVFHKLQCILKFSTFAAGTTPGQTLLSEARGLLSALQVIPTESLMSMRIILSFEEAGRYDGIVTAFRRGDPTVVGCTLDHLQTLVQQEDDLLAVMNIDSSQPSANRTKKPEAKPAPPEGTAPPNNTMQVQYPPTRGVPFRACSEFIKTGRQCYVCFNRDKFHIEVGCPILAEHDLVIVKDPTKAKSVREEFKARPQPQRRAPRGQHIKKGGSDNPPPPPPPPTNQAAGAPATENPSARRATSAEPSPRLSPPPNIPASGFEDDNYWARAGCDYFDGDDVPSDPDDGEAFQHDWADAPYSDEPAAEETKTNADFSNYFITASARRTTAKHVSATLTSVAHTALKSSQTIISKPVRDSINCCADSGATDHMFPDRNAFISYHHTPNCYVKRLVVVPAEASCEKYFR
jgi:hypothetical protein